MTFAETQKVYSVKHISLAHTIEARETIEARGELEILRFVTFEIDEFDLGELHGAKLTMDDEL